MIAEGYNDKPMAKPSWVAGESPLKPDDEEEGEQLQLELQLSQ